MCVLNSLSGSVPIAVHGYLFLARETIRPGVPYRIAAPVESWNCQQRSRNDDTVGNA